MIYILVWWVLGVIAALIMADEIGELSLGELLLLCALSIFGAILLVAVLLEKYIKYMPPINWRTIVWRKKK